MLPHSTLCIRASELAFRRSQPLLCPCSDEVYANAIFGKAHFVSIEQLVEQEVQEGNIQAEEAQTFVVSRCTPQLCAVPAWCRALAGL